MGKHICNKEEEKTTTSMYGTFLQGTYTPLIFIFL